MEEGKLEVYFKESKNHFSRLMRTEKKGKSRTWSSHWGEKWSLRGSTVVGFLSRCLGTEGR